MNLRYIVLLCCIFLSAHTCANQVILITGASRGIGYATADLLASEGYTVYAGVRQNSSQDLVSISQNKYANFHPITLDITDQNSIDTAIRTIIADEDHIDVLVNNAGTMVYGSIENVSITEAEAIFAVNFFGMMRVTQAVLPIMRSQKSGKIIQISSRSGFRPLLSMSVYAASKYALEGISETMAALLKPWNIAVCLIEPGPVDTDFDFKAPYGSKLSPEEDPYYSIFQQSGLLDPSSPIAQDPKEIAAIVKEAIEAKSPFFRYQTTDNIKQQASQRLVDISGISSVNEWDNILNWELILDRN